jgi:hypothetical protein
LYSPLPTIPTTAWKIAACLWARAALDGFEPKRLADWQDVAHHFVGSGGGSGEYNLGKLPTGEYNYYTGDDGSVYIQCEFGGCNNEKVADTEAPGWFPDTVNAVITYELVDPDHTEDGEPVESGLTDGQGDDEDMNGRYGEEAAAVREQYLNRLPPRAAAKLAAGRAVIARTTDGRDAWMVEADATQDMHTGMYRSETLHVTGSTAAIAAVKRFLKGE